MRFGSLNQEEWYEIHGENIKVKFCQKDEEKRNHLKELVIDGRKYGNGSRIMGLDIIDQAYDRDKL
jgi:hypothetical protein